MVKEKKTTGKVVKVKKSRRTFLVNKKLVIALAIAVVLVLGTYSFFSFYKWNPSSPTQQVLKPHEIIEQLVSSDNITAILIYTVSGDLDLSDKVVGIYDRLVFILQPAKMQVPSTTEGEENITIRYYLVRYETTHYLSYYLLNKLGTSPYVENLSQLIVDEEVLKSLYENVNISQLGSIKKNVKPLGEVEVNQYWVEVDNKTITIYREVRYGLPIEVVYSSRGNEVRLTLSDVIKY
ncbi:MAG: hypothetical protein QXO98_03525 [Sulfolobales archaeon]